MALTESLLDRVQFPIGRQALNRCNFLSFTLDRQKGVAFDCFSINDDRAGSTLTGVTAHIGSSKEKGFANVLNKKCSRFGIVLKINAVDTHK